MVPIDVLWLIIQDNCKQQIQATFEVENLQSTRPEAVTNQRYQIKI
jgi:hypothetical protein